MSAITNQTSVARPFQLSWDGLKLVVSPEDQDRFVKESQRAFLVSQNGLAFEKFWQQFAAEFLPAVHQWCKEHDERVEACYVAFPTDHVRVFVVRRAKRYDSTLGGDLAALEMDLFEKQWPADIIQIASGHLESFFNPAASLQVYGNGG